MKRIADTDQFVSGIIYELQVKVDGAWYAFYVGETTNADRRFAEHQWAAKNATEASTLVYRTISQQFEPAGCAWRMQPVHEYGAEGPEDAEDEHIMMLLRQGTTLTNEKKGNANWMADRQREAADMVQRKITSYRKYRQVITQEQLNLKHQEWLAEDATDQRGLSADFKQSIALAAEQRAQALKKKQERAEQQAAEVARHRQQQIREYERNLKMTKTKSGPIAFEHTVDTDQMCGGHTKDIVCGCCGNIYPKVTYNVDGEDLTMTMHCDEGCGSETIYKFWKKSGNLHLDTFVRKAHDHEATT
jgi:hypothetical protein